MSEANSATRAIGDLRAEWPALIGQELVDDGWVPIGVHGQAMWCHGPSHRTVSIWTHGYRDAREGFDVAVYVHDEGGDAVAGDRIGPFDRDEAYRRARRQRQDILDEQARLDAAALAAAGVVPPEQAALFPETSPGVAKAMAGGDRDLSGDPPGGR